MTSCRLRIVAGLASIALLLPPLSGAQTKTTPRPGYVGTFTKSNTNKVGSQVVFANLDAARPFVTWPSGNGAQTNKVFEDDEFTILFFVASVTGGTETFYLNKRTKQFTVIEATLLGSASPGEFVQPMVSHGVLK